MITSKDIKFEMEKAKEIFKNPDTTTEERLFTLYKLVNILLKVSVGNRTNLVKIMEKLGIEKVKPIAKERTSTEK